MTVDEMKKLKEELGITNEQLAEKSGVPLGTVQKVMGGITVRPRYATRTALENALRTFLSVRQDREQDMTGDKSRREELIAKIRENSCSLPADRVVEAAVSYRAEKKQGEYTLEDYYALPDERRVELIDGVFYDMSSPLSVHQLLIGVIYADLLNYVRGKGGECLPLLSPFDVQLDRDQRTMVQPDVMIVCDRKKIIRRCVYGAPDMIIEVLSPSTRKKDMGIKMMTYMEAGVREYWIIWPDQQKTVCCMLQEDSVPQIYGFQEKVPVGIWNGEHAVDFAEIMTQIGFIYDADDRNE